MGIDIYARWNGQTEEGKEAQYTGMSTVHGHVGYLREAYHGNPYATRYLCAEAFAYERKEESDPDGPIIIAAVLRTRLPRTLEIVEERLRKVYEVTDPREIEETKQSFRDFVDLCERKEKETGCGVTIVASY